MKTHSEYELRNLKKKELFYSICLGYKWKIEALQEEADKWQAFMNLVTPIVKEAVETEKKNACECSRCCV